MKFLIVEPFPFSFLLGPNNIIFILIIIIIIIIIIVIYKELPFMATTKKCMHKTDTSEQIHIENS